MKNWHRENHIIKKHEEKVLKIVTGAAIVDSTIGDGRNIPLVIIDTTERADIDNLIKNHKLYEQGEVITQWARFSRDKKYIGIFMSFKNPFECNMRLSFDITKWGPVIDLIVKSQALYLQAGREGDTYSNTIGAEMILVEIHSDNFIRNEWDKIYLEQMTKYIRRKEKLSNKESKKAARKVIEELKLIEDFNLYHG